MNKENCALKLVDEIILYYDARSKKHQIRTESLSEVLWNKEKDNLMIEMEKNYDNSMKGDNAVIAKVI